LVTVDDDLHDPTTAEFVEVAKHGRPGDAATRCKIEGPCRVVGQRP
jgi:hypothetical protein